MSLEDGKGCRKQLSFKLQCLWYICVHLRSVIVKLDLAWAALPGIDRNSPILASPCGYGMTGGSLVMLTGCLPWNAEGGQLSLATLAAVRWLDGIDVTLITSEGTSVAHFTAHTSILPTQGFCVSMYSSRVGCFGWCTAQPQQLCETLTFPGRNSTSISSTSNYGINYKRLSTSPG